MHHALRQCVVARSHECSKTSRVRQEEFPLKRTLERRVCIPRVQVVVCKEIIKACLTWNGVSEYILGKGAPCNLWP